MRSPFLVVVDDGLRETCDLGSVLDFGSSILKVLFCLEARGTNCLPVCELDLAAQGDCSCHETCNCLEEPDLVHIVTRVI